MRGREREGEGGEGGGREGRVCVPVLSTDSDKQNGEECAAI